MGLPRVPERFKGSNGPPELRIPAELDDGAPRDYPMVYGVTAEGLSLLLPGGAGSAWFASPGERNEYRPSTPLEELAAFGNRKVSEVYQQLRGSDAWKRYFGEDDASGRGALETYLYIRVRHPCSGLYRAEEWDERKGVVLVDRPRPYHPLAVLEGLYGEWMGLMHPECGRPLLERREPGGDGARPELRLLRGGDAAAGREERRERGEQAR